MSEEKGGNTGLPFGLCKKFNIELPENATPRMAWKALKDKKGLTPAKVYEQFNKEESQQSVVEKIYNDDFEGIPIKATATSHMNEKATKIFDDFQKMAVEKQWKYEHMIVVDSKGHIILSKKGGANRVALNYLDSFKVMGYNIIHNHPVHCSVLSPRDVENKVKSCAMCDLDGNRMTVVYDSNAGSKQRQKFIDAYEKAFNRANLNAKTVHFYEKKEMYNDSDNPKNLLNSKIYQEVVEEELKIWVKENIHKYKAKIYFDDK